MRRSLETGRLGSNGSLYVDLQEFVEERAVLNHCGAQVFGGGLVGGEAGGYGVGGAVVLDDAGVADGDVGGALLEVGDGIAAGLHERGDELIGLGDRALGVIDEAGLDGLPVGDEALALGGGEVADFEVFDARFAGFESGFGLLPGALLEHRAIVLRAKVLAQFRGFILALAHEDNDAPGDDENEDDQSDDESWVGRIKLHMRNSY